METVILPVELRKYLVDMNIVEDDIGQSKAKVLYLKGKSKELYLKIEKGNKEFSREQQVIMWLQERLPVPRIKTILKENGLEYLLMTKVKGEMASSSKSQANPISLVKALADGIKKLQSIKIEECPFDCTIDYKLKLAKENIEKNEVDMENWEKDNVFSSPHELYTYLLDNKPQEELVFSHGDYCLPNVFIEGDKTTGLIDLGRAGIADKWQDIALCLRSLEHNFKSKVYNDLLFEYLKIEPNYDKIRYYILLDELF